MSDYIEASLPKRKVDSMSALNELYESRSEMPNARFFLKTGRFSDVVLVSAISHTEFRAHKIILSMKSRYFAQLLSQEKSSRVIFSVDSVVLEGILPALFEMMYDARLEIPDDLVAPLWFLAVKLGVDSVTRRVFEHATQLFAASPAKALPVLVELVRLRSSHRHEALAVESPLDLYSLASSTIIHTYAVLGDGYLETLLSKFGTNLQSLVSAIADAIVDTHNPAAQAKVSPVQSSPLPERANVKQKKEENDTETLFYLDEDDKAHDEPPTRIGTPSQSPGAQDGYFDQEEERVMESFCRQFRISDAINIPRPRASEFDFCI